MVDRPQRRCCTDTVRSVGYPEVQAHHEKYRHPSGIFSRLSWVQTWQVILHFSLFLSAIVMGLLGTRRAFFILALIPLAFLPFSYARVRLHAFSSSC